METLKEKLLKQLEELRAKEEQEKVLAREIKEKQQKEKKEYDRKRRLKSLDYFLNQIAYDTLDFDELLYHLEAMEGEPDYCTEQKTALLINIADVLIDHGLYEISKFIKCMGSMQKVLAYIIKKAVDFINEEQKKRSENLLYTIEKEAGFLDKEIAIIEFMATEKPTMRITKYLFKTLAINDGAAITFFLDALDKDEINEGYFLIYLRMATSFESWQPSIYERILKLISVDKKLSHTAVSIILRNTSRYNTSLGNLILEGGRNRSLNGLQLRKENINHILYFEDEYNEALEVIPNFARIWKKTEEGSGSLYHFLRAVFQGTLPAYELKGATIDDRIIFIAKAASKNKAFMPYFKKCLRACKKLKASEENQLVDIFSDNLRIIAPYFKRVYGIEVQGNVF